MLFAKSLPRQKLYDFFVETALTRINTEIRKETREARKHAAQKSAKPTPHYYRPPKGKKPANEAYTYAVTKMADSMQAVAIAVSEGKPHDIYLGNAKDISLTQGPRLQGKKLERLREHIGNMKAINSSALFKKEKKQKQAPKQKPPVPAQAA